MTGNVYNVLVCFPLFFSLDLFIIMKIVKDSHDFTQGHVTFPMNASCFCHLPILWQMTCSQSCTLSPLLSLNCCLELWLWSKGWVGSWFFFFKFISSRQYKMFLKLNLVGKESTVLGQKACFLFLTSDLIPYAEAPLRTLQRFSMLETNLLWPKIQLSLEGIFIKSWFSMDFGHLPMKVWWSWQIALFLPEDQRTDRRPTCLVYLGLYILGVLSIPRTRSAPSVEAPSPFLCLWVWKNTTS